MDDDAPHQMRWPGVVVRLVGYAALAVVLYVLSIGPIYYVLAWRSERLNRMLDGAYAPFTWLNYNTNLSMSGYYEWWYYLPGGAAERFKRISNFREFYEGPR